ncbi:hypothetical protein BDZ91DRAFT_850553 [Kalaharituber pfeilii]|nr:hypothetical protein BDZ91DRAFT_850553 [Kalaharituber pfeilii]
MADTIDAANLPAPLPEGTKPYQHPKTLTVTQRLGVLLSMLRTVSILAVKRLLGSNTNLSTQVQKQLSYQVLKALSVYAMAPYMPNTTQNYNAYCKKTNKTPQITELELNTKALWVFGTEKPQKPEDKLFLFFHGGGYALGGATDDQIRAMTALSDEAKKKGIDTSGVFLQYDLSIDQPYPRQLHQAVIILNHLTNTQGWSPRQIILLGDSAGANLIFSVLLHALKPCLHVPLELKLSEPLFMVIPISPWVLLRWYEPVTNDLDIIAPEDINNFIATVLPPDNKVDVRWTNFTNTPHEWWHGLGKLCQHMLIIGGDEEILWNDIKEFAQVILNTKKEDPESKDFDVELVGAAGVHAEATISFGTDVKDIPQFMAIANWFNSRLSN